MTQSEGALSSNVDIEDPSTLHYSAQHDPSCACMRLKEYKPVTFAHIESSSASCRLSCLYRDIVIAAVGGCLPAAFEAGSRNEAEHQFMLEQLTISSSNRARSTLTLHILEQNVTIAFFRDGDTEPDRDFTVRGRSFPRGFRIGRLTNSRESFRRAQKWLHECLTNHTCPRPSSAAVPLPKRLLGVQGSAHDPIQLLETQGNEHPYVCLSHRWGSSTHKQLKTTIRTIQDHIVKIDWHNLPATFQDAVTVCRSMGVNYLWIDSLCILQHFDGITSDELEVTEQDFAQENSMMAKTYQNSLFTISADLSTHMDSGMFSKLPIDEGRIEVTADDGERALLYTRQHVNHHNEKIPDLETRGWCFQEFLLPSRVLHFGYFDLEWRCKTRLTCECGHLDCERPKQASWHRHHYVDKAAKSPPADLKGALRWWETVVHSYTTRKLANPSDKLPALSGLAQLRKQTRGGVYLAGLWQDLLIHDLCWYHIRTPEFTYPISGGVGRRPAGYRAPSWSWASVDTDSRCSFWWTGNSGIHLWAEPRQVCDILESFCQPKTPDPTGEVRDGFLDIKVALIPAEICRDPEEKVVWTIQNIETTMALVFFNPDCRLEDDGLAIGGRVYCAPITESTITTGFERGCLVLKKLGINTYQRVGFCILQLGETPHPWDLHHGLLDIQDPSKFKPPNYIQIPDSSKEQIKIL